jgi:hypothetical protein
MFIDSQYSRAGRSFTLSILAPQVILKPALHRRPADAFPLPQSTPVYAIPVRHENTPPERLGGPLTRQYPWKPLPKAPLAIPAEEFAGFQLQHTVA